MSGCSANRYAWRSMGIALISAVLAILIGLARRAGLIPDSLRWLAAILPVIPLIWYFLGIGRWLKSLDELQRLIQLEALQIQFGLTGIFIILYGSLAKFGVVPDSVVSEAWPWFWLVLFFSWALGQLLVRRKYR